jgi:hypothetical protein
MSYVELGAARTREEIRARREASKRGTTPAVFNAPSRMPRGAVAPDGLVTSADQIRCTPYGLDRSFLDFLNKLDNKLVFQRLQVNWNKPTKYKDFFGHQKTVLKSGGAARKHWLAVKYALSKAVADKKVPIMMGPYFIPFGLPEQLKKATFRQKLAAAGVLEDVEDFFYRISAMSLLKSHKGYFEKILKQRGNQLTIAGWPEYPFGWVGAQLGFETEDWPKLAKAYYDGLIELEKRTCTRKTVQPKPVPSNVGAFRDLLAKTLRDNKPIVDVLVFWLPEDVKKDVYSGKLFPMVWETFSGLENLFVTAIERVRLRSGKNTRKLSNIFGESATVPMKAEYGQPLNITLAQWLTLFTTEWFALHDELLRILVGSPRGQRGPLGSLGEAATAATGTVAAAAPVAAAGAGYSGMGLAASIVGATGAIVPAVLGLIGEQEKTKRAGIEGDLALEKARLDAEVRRAELLQQAAADERKAAAAAEDETSGPEGPGRGKTLAQTSSGSPMPLLLVAGAIGAFLILSKGKK